MPADKLLRGLQLFGYYARTNYVVEMAAEDLRAGALRALPELGYIAGLAPGLAMDMAVCTLEAARAGAYNTVVSFQECTSLVEGFSMVKGRESEHKGMTIEQMAVRFPDTPDGRNRLNSFIWYQATNASYREQGGQMVSDPNVARAVYNKCYTDLVSRWREQRLKLITDFNTNYREYLRLLAGNRPVITFSPSDEVPLRDQGGGKKAATVTIYGSTAQNRDKMNDVFGKMKATLKALEGKGGDVLFISEKYLMALDGKWLGAEYSPAQKTYTYRALGTHSVALRHELSLTATVVSADVEEHSLLGGYRKAFEDTVADNFSIVEDGPRGALRVSGYTRVKVNQRFSLTAEIVGASVPSSQTGRGLGEGRPPDRQLAEPLHRRGGSRHLHLHGRALRQAGWKVPETGRREAHRRRREGGGENAGQADRQAAGEETRHHADAKRTEAAGKERPPAAPAEGLGGPHGEGAPERARLPVRVQLHGQHFHRRRGLRPEALERVAHCAKAANGPCINQGYGCWRHFPDGGSECAKKCYTRYNTTGAPSRRTERRQGQQIDFTHPPRPPWERTGVRVMIPLPVTTSPRDFSACRSRRRLPVPSFLSCLTESLRKGAGRRYGGNHPIEETKP